MMEAEVAAKNGISVLAKEWVTLKIENLTIEPKILLFEQKSKE